MNTYWDSTGIHQSKLDILHNLIDTMLGENGVKNPVKNKQLERLRKMKNAYYRLFNDGDSNGRLLGVYHWDVQFPEWMSFEQRQQAWDNIHEEVEPRMDAQIFAAWKEQKALGNI